ncbi:MAG: 6-phosphogluconolactonase [Chloroflexia bacterium]
MNAEIKLDVVILPTKDDVAARGAEEFIAAAQKAVEERGRFVVALAGGSTPDGAYRLLSAGTDSPVEWERVSLYWSDERCVAPDHPDSNYGAAKRALLDRLDLQPTQVHRMRGEEEPTRAADMYEAELRADVVGDPPRFDLVMLGMGDDGHTASLFPHSAALDVMDRLISANHVEKLGADRLTFTTPLINAARMVMFLVTGEGKAAALREVLEGEQNAHEYPSQLVAPTNGRLLWVVDEAAAGSLSDR